MSLKLVFSDYRYLILAAAIGAVFFSLLSMLAEFMFLSPYFVIHVPDDSYLGFSLIVILSIMSGLVISMNVYRIKIMREGRTKMGGSFLGSIIGASAGACGCGPVGFAVISTFGTVGGVATAFLSTYEIHIRVAAIAILGYTYYATSRALKRECKIKINS
jgi:hypothetical protein